jgi:S1-C subfamily serine protease
MNLRLSFLIFLLLHGPVTLGSPEASIDQIRGLSSEALCLQLGSGITQSGDLLEEIHRRGIICGEAGDLGQIDYTPEPFAQQPQARAAAPLEEPKLTPTPQDQKRPGPPDSEKTTVSEASPLATSPPQETTVVRISTPRAAGSGFYLDPTHVVTNAHVVGRTPWVELAPSGGASFKGQVIYRNADLDFAIIETETPGIPGMIRRTPLILGEGVAALGYPQGRTILAASTGTIRDLDPCCILHDALIAGGSSGGPLLDSTHQVLGLNTLLTKHPGDDTNRYDRGIALRLDFIARMILESTQASTPASRP